MGVGGAERGLGRPHPVLFWAALDALAGVSDHSSTRAARSAVRRVSTPVK